MSTVFNTDNVPVEKRLMFLGPPLSLQRYDQFKYKKFFDLWEKQENFRWRPERIDLSKDRTDYEKLNKTERFIFDSNIRWQTMTDSMLSRGIHELSKYVTNPELEICLGTWANMEQIHSYSYTYIFKNITKDATKFFDSILEDNEIVQRAQEIRASYDDLLIYNEIEESDIKERILETVLFTNATESISFYTSFVCSFYFGYRGLMEGSAKIIGEIARDENLHVAITQNIIKNWKTNREEGFQGLINKKEKYIYKLYNNIAENEKKWTKYLFSKGSLVGLNEELLCKYIEWLTDTRLLSMGYDRIYNQKKNPITWVSRYFDSSKVQVAPQETEVESYLVGSANTKLADEDFDKIKL